MEQEIEKFLNTIDSSLGKEEKIYIVGGFLRDFILKRKTKEIIDIDFIVEDDIYNLSKNFAGKIKGAWFVLDEANKVIRVVKKTQKTYQFDFALLKGKDVYEDLSLRDFTINAFAIEIHAFCEERFDFIDPFKAREDIDKKIIRMIKQDNLKDTQ
jgi:tRNA nucleotidyltransferase/poly(A) polymerase